MCATEICAHWVFKGEAGENGPFVRREDRRSLLGWIAACWPFRAWQSLFSRLRPSAFWCFFFVFCDSSALIGGKPSVTRKRVEAKAAFWWVGVSLPPSSGCLHCGSMGSCQTRCDKRKVTLIEY